MDKMEYVKKNWVAVEATIPKKSLLSRIISKISSE
jgi:hypothetical protein